MEAAKKLTPGKVMVPCPYCGCPDEFDHTQDCPVLPEVVDLQRQVKELQHNQGVLADSLSRTITECAQMAGLLADIGRIMKGEKPIHLHEG
jgi:hypothetical protein